MTDRDRTLAAVDVLLEQALELQPSIEESLERATEAVRELTLLLQAEESLRDAERTLSGRKRQLTSASSLASSRWKRSERASRGLRELEQLGRAAENHSLALKRVAQRRSSRGNAMPAVADLRVMARGVALPNGRFRVQDLADVMQRRDPERYSSSRSAYAAIYDQLRRSPDFERAGPGEFVLASDHRDPATAALGHTTEEPADALPFEVSAPPTPQAGKLDADDLPFE